MEAAPIPLPLQLAPGALVIGCLFLFGRVWPSRMGIVLTVWAMLLYYLSWRIGETIDWGASAPALGWMLLVLAVELLAIGDAVILHLMLLKGTDRSLEADRHMIRLSSADPGSLPPVDVYIATYNEPLDVLEKTIQGALALEWPDRRVWVLDDGRRPWLRDYCAQKGAGWITRPDNAGAKAGNINHALQVTDAPYVAVFDADFVPRQDFLLRTMGFFADEKVGIVQVPHSFYNSDPMQANLSLRQAMPDDQRFFFEAIMPGRDGWDAAFCCGSNSVTRRALFDEIGGGLPHGSITEDMLLTLAGLRAGYVTRYLNEPLAWGLAPESVEAFFVQRQRWAQGAMQILHLKEGPLGPGLSFVHRLMFLPTHWISQGLAMLIGIVAPILFLLTGVVPLTNVTLDSVVQRLLPMVIASLGGIAALAPGRYYPTAAQVMGLFQSFRILPVALQTLVRPKGIPFRVTPKGREAGMGWEQGIFWVAAALLALNLLGLGINARPDYRIVDQAALVPMVAFWSLLNMVMLGLVMLMCLQMPARRGEERFRLTERVVLERPGAPPLTALQGDISLTGLGVDGLENAGFAVGQELTVRISDVGRVPARVVRVHGGRVGLVFGQAEPQVRDRLVVKLYATGMIEHPARPTVWAASYSLVSRLWLARMTSNPIAPDATSEQTPMEKLPPGRRVLPPISAPQQADRLRA